MDFSHSSSEPHVVYEEKNILAINKPGGLPSNPLNKDDEKKTAVDFAISHCRELKKSFPDSFEPGLLHRLDVGTSGLLLFAKNEAAFTRLRNFWKTEAVRKIYTAWVTDETPPLELTHPIARSLNHKSRMLVIDRPELRLYRGKAMEAHTRVISCKKTSEKYYELEIEILTGVMHQIRVHLAHENLPIVGDELYKGAEFKRLCLHSSRLEIDEVIFGKKITIKT
ncbi:MAG: RNA pseudouridine synthase [Xanthomonadaceae bacterium]|nr:RNA pseudouridine synthase [Xanthomonadaceae bacterium]